jgi:hypothetical protein
VSSKCPDAAAQRGREAPVGQPAAQLADLEWEAAPVAGGCADDGSPADVMRDRRARSRANAPRKLNGGEGFTRRATRVPASRPSPGREMNRRPAPVSPANRIRSLRLCQWISSKDLRGAGVQRFGGATPRTAGCGPQAKKDLVVQDPHLRSSAPLEPPGKSDRAWGNSLNVAHNVDSPPRTRVAVEAQLRDETSFYRQDREISFQVPGSFSEELSEYAGPVTLRGRGRC